MYLFIEFYQSTKHEVLVFLTDCDMELAVPVMTPDLVAHAVAAPRLEHNARHELMRVLRRPGRAGNDEELVIALHVRLPCRIENNQSHDFSNGQKTLVVLLVHAASTSTSTSNSASTN